MSKPALYHAFNRLGLCQVHGYDEDGYAGSWSIRRESDIDRLPTHLCYEIAR